MASTSSLISPLMRHGLLFKSFRTQNMFNFRSKQVQGIILTRAKSSWHRVAAVCLERKPIISQPMNKLEKEYWEMLQKKEVESSLLSDHEIRHKEDLLRAERIKNDEADATEIEKASKVTAQDEEDMYTEELNKFKPASRITDDNPTSIDRQLEKSLVLVIKEKLGKNNHWILPQAIHKEGETLRETAERALGEIAGPGLKVCFMGNAPVGYYKYKYPKSARTEEEIFGAKVFFFKARHIKGNVSLTDEKTQKSKEFKWLTQSELPTHLQKEYCKAVESFLIGESQVEGNLTIEKPEISQDNNGIIIRAIQKSN